MRSFIIMQAGLDRLGADAQGSGDFLGPPTLGQGLQYLALACGQRRPGQIGARLAQATGQRLSVAAVRARLAKFLPQLDDEGAQPAAFAAALRRLLAGERDPEALCAALALSNAMIIETTLAALADPSVLADLGIGSG